MPKGLTLQQIEHTRAHLWRTAPARQIGDERGALRFIKELGFVLLLSLRGSELPSIHNAAGGQWGVWWDWKQTLPERKACFYSHLLRRHGTFLSWEWFPAFHAAYAETQTYRQLFREGLLDRTEKQVLDLLDTHGPLLTRELRLLYAPPSKENTRRIKQVLVELQRRFLICAAGGTTEGWSHHRWDLVERWVGPELMLAARGISREAARERLVAQSVRTSVATTAADIAWLFGWERSEVQGLLARVIAAGRAETVYVPELEGEVIIPRPWPRGGR
jgi:hypothetical protein